MVLSRSWPIRLRATPILLRSTLRSSLCANWPAAGFIPVAVPVLALLSGLAAMGSGVAQAQPQSRLAEKPLPREVRHEGIVIKVTPLLVDPVTAFLIGRGFPTPMRNKRGDEQCVSACAGFI